MAHEQANHLVTRLAEQVSRDTRLAKSGVQGGQVQVVAGRARCEGRLDDPPAEKLEPEEERRVHRRIDDDAGAGRGHRLNDFRDARHDIGDRECEVGIGRPAQPVRRELREYGTELAHVRVAAVASTQRRDNRIAMADNLLLQLRKSIAVFANPSSAESEVALAVCDRIGLSSKDIDLLVTNQPNKVFLRNWREALELPPERHRDTFDDCGNLFGAGIPINLDRAISDGQVKAGDMVMMAAFAHAGDFAGAAAVRWGGRD